MCVIQSWPQLSHLTLPAGVRVSSVIFRQVGSNRQFSRLKMVTDNCLQLYFVNFERMELKYYANSDWVIRRHSNQIVAQRGITLWWQITWFIGHSGTVNISFHCEWGRRSIANAYTCHQQCIYMQNNFLSITVKWLSIIAFYCMAWTCLHLEQTT